MKVLLLFCGLLLASEVLGQEYFRKSDFIRSDCDSDQRYDEWSRNWYTRTMRKFGEPSFLESNFEYPVYRFLWMPSFDSLHVITIHFADSTFVTWKTASDDNEDLFSDKLDYSLFNIKSGKVSIGDVFYIHSWERIISDLGFWHDSSMEPCLWLGVNDGSRWLFEARNADNYKIINRSNPDQYSKYFLLGLLFFKVAGKDKALSDLH